MNFPKDIKYSKSHEWMRALGSETVVVGITDFAQSRLGDIVYVDFKQIRNQLSKGEAYCEIESVKAVESSYMPISGKISEKNSQIEENYGLINSSPYDKGWLIKITASNPEEFTELLSNIQYEDYLKEFE